MSAPDPDDVDSLTDQFVSATDLTNFDEAPGINVDIFGLLRSIVLGFVLTVAAMVATLGSAVGTAVTDILGAVGSAVGTWIDVIIAPEQLLAIIDASSTQLAGAGPLGFLVAILLVGSALYIASLGVDRLVGE
jgi:hypothetical protein